MINNIEESSSYKRGASSPVVEAFTINGLYGYRSISLTSPYMSTILIAQNGSGKTTLLSALDSFLRCQYTRLMGLDFQEITCKLYGIENSLVIRKEDIIKLRDIPQESELNKLAINAEISPFDLLRFIVEDYSSLKDDYRALREEKIYRDLSRMSSYRTNELTKILNNLYETAFAHSPNLKVISETVRNLLTDVEILYLPTYRRVEIPISSDGEPEDRYNRMRRRNPAPFARGIFQGDIQFGLGDIFERLSDLNQEVLFNSNRGYREISANIINELIDGSFENDAIETDAIPRPEELKMLFSRLKEASHYEEFSIPNIDKIYSNDSIPKQSDKFLRYFLNKLNTVVKATKEIEAQVENFIEKCNKYLSSDDANKSSQLKFDDKLLKLDRNNLNVHAESRSSGKKIPLDALSSGEKQMISLFAKLFLYPKNKIILIDEPELSLSLDWQRQILTDLVDAPQCKQLIAITHSPFVFDNVLEPFARPLETFIDKEMLDQLSLEEEDLGD